MTIIKRRHDHFYILSCGISRYHTMLDHVMNRGPACHWVKHQTADRSMYGCAVHRRNFWQNTRPLNQWGSFTPQNLMTRQSDPSMNRSTARRRIWWQDTRPFNVWRPCKPQDLMVRHQIAQRMDSLYAAEFDDKITERSWMDSLYAAEFYDKTPERSVNGFPVRRRILWQDTRTLGEWIPCAPQNSFCKTPDHLRYRHLRCILRTKEIICQFEISFQKNLSLFWYTHITNITYYVLHDFGPSFITKIKRDFGLVKVSPMLRSVVI